MRLCVWLISSLFELNELHTEVHYLLMWVKRQDTLEVLVLVSWLSNLYIMYKTPIKHLIWHPMESTSFYILIQKHSLSVNGFTKFATSTCQSCFCSNFIFSTSVIASTETSVHFCFFFFVHLSFSLLLTLTLSVFWRSQHGTSTKAPLSSSVQLINQHLFFFLFHFFSLPFTCPLWLSLFLFTLFYLLSLHTPFPLFSLSCHSTSLPLFFRLFLPFYFPSGSWSASWSTPGVVPWEEAVTMAWESSSRPESAQHPPGSRVDWWRGTNWRRLPRWWKEKAWPADLLRSVPQERSSLGKTFFLNIAEIVFAVA